MSEQICCNAHDIFRLSPYASYILLYPLYFISFIEVSSAVPSAALIQPQLIQLLGTSLPFFRLSLHSRHQPINSPGRRRPRPGGSPWHDLHRVSPLQRGCEPFKTALFPLYCALVRPQLKYAIEANTQGWYKPTGEGSTPCNTASERFLSRAIWGKASTTQPLVTGT